jgi:Ca2+-binding RTX toxin-like protein
MAAPSGSYPLNTNSSQAPAAADLSGPAASLFSPTQQGDAGGDILIGGDGDDMIVGGDGSDFMISGFGQSTATESTQVETGDNHEATHDALASATTQQDDVPMLQDNVSDAGDLRAALDMIFAEMAASEDSSGDGLDLL